VRAGPLRDRVELQVPTSSQDAGGGAVVVYATEDTRYGALIPLTAHERLGAGQTGSRLAARLTLRYYDGLDETYRVKVGSTVYGVMAVINPDGRKREHVLDLVLAP
jgi:SPP1 family predicted phage head-tail adaptor